MIASFADRLTKALFDQGRHARVGADVARTAFRKLVLLHRARDLDDLRALPGNRLEKLKGDRAGQWSNDQWRLCFRVEEDGFHDVQFTDYH